MTLNPQNLFHLQRQPLIDTDQSARIHALAARILDEIGIEVRHEPYRQRLRAAGLRVSGDRVFFEPGVVNQYVEEERRRREHAGGQAAAPEPCISLHVSSYSLFVQDLRARKVVPYTTERVIEMTKLIDSLTGERVYGAPPGIPTDVDPDLQPLAQYRIAALYARQGATPVDPTSARTVRYLLEMAEVMDSPIRALPVYIPTPLRLGGESLDVVMSCLDRLDHISVGSMPAAGTSAPMLPFGALALAAAEVIGGAIAVHHLTGKPVSFWANIFPSNLRDGSMVFGSPENMLFQMLGEDFARFYRPGGAPGGPGNIHVMAKYAGGQSAAEKAAIMALGAALGARWFSCAGTLSLDEIFSAEQLLLDCEIRDWVERAVQGVDLGEAAVSDWVEELRQGVANGFMALDSTLDHYKRQTWYPRWFDRGAIGPWLNDGQPDMTDRLRKDALRRIAAHDFELEPGKRAAIEQIYAAAERQIRT
jgi:trimethylamine---corrinoid protein Co-methyltransferase